MSAESKYPLPLGPEVVLVTWDMAGDWLDHRNHPGNRKMSKHIVGKYADDMLNNRWKLTPEGMIFDTDGLIISAQHRLAAVRLAKVDVPFWIFPDQPRDIFDAVDQGYKRGTAQLLHIPFAAQVAAAAKWLTGGPDIMRTLNRMSRVTTAEVLATIDAWPELTWDSEAIFQVYRKTRIAAAPHAVVVAQAQRTEFRGLIPEWLEGLKTGANLGADDPRRQLRERFMGQYRQLSGSAQRPQVYGLIAKAWNAWALGEKKTVLRWMVTEPLPEIAGSRIDRKTAA